MSDVEAPAASRIEEASGKEASSPSEAEEKEVTYFDRFAARLLRDDEGRPESLEDLKERLDPPQPSLAELVQQLEDLGGQVSVTDEFAGRHPELRRWVDDPDAD